ncbi:efflux RND transporter periplasmic adaptor subunit [Corynebacterium lizhenjunii]|uniref:efflux RND transporter periplasmic adaptor subunit n=1 Tax=Corynebacterium lizhenjunii TaxID=2709394 RepID=UPI0013EE3143|nr:efflux RND transporter periplasmic adaptor subunit [Corynebacterium lizhenjunii]
MSKKTIAVAAGLGVLALAGAGGVFALTHNSSEAILTAADITHVAPADLSTEISASGTVAGQREVALSTTLTGPVQSLDAKVGDRVEAQQLLATIDTTATQRELDTQRATQAVEQQQAYNNIESAQLQLSQLQDSVAGGLNPEINSAKAAVDQARSAYDDAVHQRDDGPDSPEVAQARTAVKEARSALSTAHNSAIQASLTALSQNASPEADGPSVVGSLINLTEADDKVVDARRHLTEAEESLARQLEAHDVEAARHARAAATAYRGVSEAELGLQAAEMAVQHQIDTRSQAVDHALKGAASAGASAEIATKSLQLQLSDAAVRTPLAGVVTAVNATTGQPAQGALLTVTDDSVLRVRVKVKEADISDISIGDKVTFTSPSAPGKTFRGKVTFISPTSEAAKSEATGSESGSARNSAEFPVEIQVEGSREGLRLGSTAKVKIITDERTGVLSVPLSAVIHEGEKSYVLRVRDGVVERQEVTVGTESSLNAAIDKGLSKGDAIISQAETHLDLVGQPVQVLGDGGAAGASASKGQA